MPNPIAMIDYQKCNPERCDRVLRQEAPYEFPFSHPSHFCQGCAKCVQACPFTAIRIV